MPKYICKQCGVQYSESVQLPLTCPICEDERQYVNWEGQQWTTLEELQTQGFSNTIELEGPAIYGIGTKPQIAIGQRALLVKTPAGNVLWDCITYIDEATIEKVKSLGGIQAIAISHPHYYSSMVEWSQAFDNAPIYIHNADRQWVARPEGHIVFWEGETLEILDGLTVIQAGVHFEGGTVLHWRDGEQGQGALLSGDIFQVVSDRRYTSFMYSYPNLIPERPEIIRQALARVSPFSFEVIYGAWWQRIVSGDAKNSLLRSAQRYLDRIGAAGPE